MVAAIYDWSGFYVGLNGGWGSSRKCWESSPAAGGRRCSPKAATMRPVAPSAARLAIAGRHPIGCSAWKRRATGLTSRDRNVSSSSSFRRSRERPTRIEPSACSPARSAIAFNNALLYVKGGAAVTADRYSTLRHRHRCRVRSTRRRNPLGCRGRRRPRIRLRPELVGRHRVQSHVHAVTRSDTFNTLARHRRALHRPHPPGRRCRHRPRQLPLGWPGRREVLIAST